jgi:carbonic anhydrase/acetyltransferase-like protein (isoleucine patch superfamily)
MANFAISTSDPYSEVVSSLNYVLANLGQGTGTGTDANVLVANVQTGEITSNSTVVSYLYQYMDVKYANSSTGGSGFSSNCTLANYFGLRNTANTTISSNPADYVWYQVTGGFGTTKNLWYNTYGGRQVSFFAGNAAPAPNYIPTVDDVPINLDVITGTAANQIINVNAYFASNTAPATPSGGFYDFATVTLTPPTGWSANIPTVGNTAIYISSDVFQGNATANVGPSRPWTTPAAFITPFNANAGPPGSRGFVPMGYVLTSSDPTGYTSSQFTTAFSESRSNPSPPIGLGYAPIANDTAQFAYEDLFTGNTITTVQTYNGTTWSPVVGEVVSGGLIVPGSINANTLNANQVYAVTVASTNANVGNIASPGFWMQTSTGNARFGGNTNIGNNLTVGQNAVIGDSLTIGGTATIGDNLVVGTSANIGSGLTIGSSGTIGDNLTIGNNLFVGTNARIGNNLNVGNNASIGGNLFISGLISSGALIANTVSTGAVFPGAISTTVATTTSTTQNQSLAYTQSTIYNGVTTTISNPSAFPVLASVFASGTIQVTTTNTFQLLYCQLIDSNLNSVVSYYQNVPLQVFSGNSKTGTFSINMIGLDTYLTPATPSPTFYLKLSNFSNTGTLANITFTGGAMTLQYLKR